MTPVTVGLTGTIPTPFLDHRSFELSKDPHHPKEYLAGWRRRVDALPVNEQVHFHGVDLRKEFDEV